jgi:glycosyltransferase involved in cell wall biosynthesis
MSAAFGTVPGARVLHYHNVTPARFFAPFDAGLARVAAAARTELADLAGRVDLAVGDSEYNRRELDSLGFRRTGVVPILLDLERLTGAPRVPALEWMLQDGLTNILFVGRIAPNKRLEDHIRLAEHYMRYVDAFYRFIFVGRYDVVPGYYESVRAMMATYRMVPERFWFTGPVPDRELAAYYRNAHAYVSLSEHEGFCVPLVEAMAMDVPVLAYADAAVPETLGGAGVSFRPKDLEFAAELLGGLIYDAPFRQGVLAGQRTRVRDFGRGRVEPALRHMLEIVTA